MLRSCEAVGALGSAFQFRAPIHRPRGSLATLQELEHLGVGFVSLIEALDLTNASPSSDVWIAGDIRRVRKKRFCGNERGLAWPPARQNGKRLGRPATAAQHTAEIRKLHRAGVNKSEIARRVQIGRTSVRRILGVKS